MMIKRLFFIFFVLLISGASLSAKSISDTVEDGNLHYDKAEYNQALMKYRDAQIYSPEAAELHFNIGDALFKKKDYAGAEEAYQKSINSSDDATLHAQAYYNIGNSLFRAAEDSIQLQNSQGAVNNMIQSIDYYKRSLEINPEDQDTKFNLEYVRTILKELSENQDQDQQNGDQQQQSQQSEQQKGEEGDQNQDQQGDQDQQDTAQDTAQDKEEDGDQEKDKKDGQDGEDGEEDQPPEGESQARKEGEMSEEEAERLLNALLSSEEELQKEQQKQQIPTSGQYGGKKW